MDFIDGAVPKDWALDTLAYAEFRDGRADTAPLTWAQQTMWRAAALSPNNHVFMNLRRTVPVSPRAPGDVASVARAIGALVARHSALRTQVRSIDGQLRQEAAAAGRLSLLVVPAEADGTEAAQATADRLGNVAFDHAAEWPLRVALVVVEDRVRQIVLVFSHSTVDAYAVDVVLRDLRLILLRGALTTPPGPQSVEVAQQQHGVDRRRSERAVDYWIHQYAGLPQQALNPIGPGLAPRLRRGVLVSPAIDGAARLIAARHRVSVSAVLLAGMTALAAGGAGREICGLFSMSHNRFRPTYTDAVANLGQMGFCVVDLAGRPSFAEVLPRVWQASLAGYRHAYYDPASMRHRFEEAGYDYSTAFLPYYYFNDVRLPGGGADTITSVTESGLRAAMQRSTFSWTDGLDVASWHLLTHVVDQPGAVGITLTIDTRFLALDWVEPFLRNLEELLVEAAFREVTWPWSPTARAARS